MIKKYWRIALLVIAIALIVTGIITGDYVSVYRKAVMICYECVGIG